MPNFTNPLSPLLDIETESLQQKLVNLKSLEKTKKDAWDNLQILADIAKGDASSAYENWMKCLDEQADIIRELKIRESSN